MSKKWLTALLGLFLIGAVALAGCAQPEEAEEEPIVEEEDTQEEGEVFGEEEPEEDETFGDESEEDVGAVEQADGQESIAGMA